MGNLQAAYRICNRYVIPDVCAMNVLLACLYHLFIFVFLLKNILIPFLSRPSMFISSSMKHCVSYVMLVTAPCCFIKFGKNPVITFIFGDKLFEMIIRASQST